MVSRDRERVSVLRVCVMAGLTLNQTANMPLQNCLLYTEPPSAAEEGLRRSWLSRVSNLAVSAISCSWFYCCHIRLWMTEVDI